MASKLDNDALDELFSNLKEKKISKVDEPKKKKIKTVKCCCAAKEINTKGNAYKDIISGKEVCLVRTDVKGVYKTKAYSRCSKTIKDGQTFCHLHIKMSKNNNDNILIYETDVLPQIKDDKNRYIAAINDDFFETMGKRGAKKKNLDNNFIFSNKNNPILEVLNHPKGDLSVKLAIYASQLLKKSDDSHVISLHTDGSKPELDIDSDSDSESDSEDEADEKSVKEQISDLESEDDLEVVEVSEEEEISVIEIETHKGKTYYLNESNNDIIDPEDDTTVVGVLIEISKKYSTITHNDVEYSILKELEHEDKGKVYYCILSNKIFDKNLEHIGSAKMLKDNKLKYKFK